MAQTPKPSDAVRIGQVFLEKYRVESILGQGGMGVVAECTHLQLNERVALKMLRQDVLLDRDAVERFMREAQAAVKLKSEYVARVRDVGTLEDGTPFMVMEYLDGQDLGVLIEERGTLPAPWATELILQTCEGLAEAHSLGIVHRDVKPTNLFVTWRPDGTALIKVLDFGISKSPMGTDMHLTQTQSLLGTPAYMSPEQMRSARLVDGRTDIWSLGTVLYELLEGRKPFEAESFSEMCVKVAVDSPTPMERTSVDLQQVVLRCLAKSPDARYQSMADLARDLVPFTQDPQSGSMLVERMQRMQRRAEGGWEGSTTGVGLRGVPHHVRDVGSAPVRAQSSPVGWHGGSDPAGARWHGGSDASGQMFRSTPPPGSLGVPQRTAIEKSAPAISPSELRTHPEQPRRKFAFVLLGAALVGIAGVLIAMKLSRSEPEPQASTVEPPVVKMEVNPPEPTPPTPVV
ncbi:MAG: serine/threonine protein kinase, partial [Deltaproteobacteria bacterium]|nr:serine/threonine protein kinase [Deltaproteobacteria bacterium]